MNQIKNMQLWTLKTAHWLKTLDGQEEGVISHSCVLGVISLSASCDADLWVHYEKWLSWTRPNVTIVKWMILIHKFLEIGWNLDDKRYLTNFSSLLLCTGCPILYACCSHGFHSLHLHYHYTFINDLLIWLIWPIKSDFSIPTLGVTSTSIKPQQIILNTTHAHHP